MRQGVSPLKDGEITRKEKKIKTKRQVTHPRFNTLHDNKAAAIQEITTTTAITTGCNTTAVRITSNCGGIDRNDTTVAALATGGRQIDVIGQGIR